MASKLPSALFSILLLGSFLSAPMLVYAGPSLPRLLVRYSDGVDPASQRQILTQNFPLHSRKFLSLLNIEIFEVEGGSIPSVVANAVSLVLGVLRVELDQPIFADEAPDDPYLERQWHLQSAPDLGIQAVWDAVNGLEAFPIAVIDSGCELNHEEIAPNLWRNPGEIPGNGVDDDEDGYIDNVFGYDFVNSAPNPVDDNGHGTMVFGIVAAAGNNGQGIAGMVWNADVMCLKVLGRNGAGKASDAIEAIEFAIAHGAKILNLSWGAISLQLLSQALQESIRMADDAGVLVVASAGNEAVHIDINLLGIGHYPSSFPEENIIAVTSTDQSDELSDFSDYGKNDVDLAAPGERIYTTALNGSFAYFTGTSASAPVVTGAAALLWSLNPSLGHLQVKELILNSVDKIPDLNGKVLSGGRVNVAEAVKAAPSGLSPQNPEGQRPPTNIPDGLGGEAAGGCSLQVKQVK